MKKLLSSFVALAVLLGISSQAVFAEELSQSATPGTTQDTAPVTPANQANGQGAAQWSAGNDPLSFKNDPDGCKAKGFYYDTEAKDCFPSNTSNMGTQNTTSGTPTTQSNGQGATWNFAQKIREEVQRQDNFGQYLNTVERHNAFREIFNELQERRNNFGQFLNADERREEYENLKEELKNKISVIKEKRKKASLKKFESKTTKKILKLRELVAKYEAKLANTKSKITRFYQSRINALKHLIEALEERIEEFKEELTETIEEEAEMAIIEVESELDSDMEVNDETEGLNPDQMEFPPINVEGGFDGQNQQNGQQGNQQNGQMNDQQGNLQNGQQGNQQNDQPMNQSKNKPIQNGQKGNKSNNQQANQPANQPAN